MLVPPPPGDGAGWLASGAGSSAAAASDAADAAELSDAADAAELPHAMPLHGDQLPQEQQAAFLKQFNGESGSLHAKLLYIHTGLVASATLESRHSEKFFTVVERKKDNQQQLKVACLACKKVLMSTGSNRMVGHIVKCDEMPKVIKNGFKALQERSKSMTLGKRQAATLAAEEAEIWAKKHASSQSLLKQSGIKASLQEAERAWADKCIAEFFYANAIPFGVAGTGEAGLYSRMVSAIKAAPKSYIPPNRHKLGGVLLDTCFDGMWKQIQARDPDGSQAYKYGATYVTDGWDSCDSRPLINSAFISNNDGGIFWRSVNTSGHTKDANYIATLMIADIYAYGPTKVVLVITDTCTTMKSAWEIVMTEFPWISCLPCQPHVVSLLLKDIGKTPEVR